MIDYKELEPPIRKVEYLPVVSPREATRTFVLDIQKVVRGIEYPVRYGQRWIEEARHLFSMVGGEEYSEVKIPDYPTLGKGSAWGRIEAQKGAEALFDVMTQFGLYTSKTTKFSSHLFLGGSSQFDFKDVFTEIIDYPSQTIPGLVFIRTRGYNLKHKDSTVFVSWHVSDRAPEYAINWRRLFPVVNRLLLATH